MEKILDQPQRYKIIEDNGVYYPENAKGKHGRLKNTNLKETMQKVLESLSNFHKYAEEKNILYSLNGGTLIGYYWNGQLMPWDDDIDIWLCEKDYLKVKEDLWENGEPCDAEGIKWWKRSRATRMITLGDKQYILKSNKIEGEKGSHLTKIIPIDYKETNAGWMDIGMCRRREGELKEAWKEDRPCYIPESPKEKDFPIVELSGIKTRAVVRELGEPVLEEVYGPKWRIPCHPKMKENFNINPYLKEE